MQKKIYRLLAAALIVAVFTNCGRREEPATSEADEHAGHAHAEAGHAQTIWEGGLEVFAEWSELNSRQEAEFTIHLTDLADFKPIAQGSLTLEFTQHGNSVLRVQANAPARPGMYDVDVTAPAAGDYDVSIILTRGGETLGGVLRGVHVLGSGDNHDGHEHEGHDHAEHADENKPSAEELITLTKELQWQLDFATATVSNHVLHENIRALGELQAAGVGEAEVFAPFDGVLMPDPMHGIVRPGQRVSKGEVLARIAPSGGSENNWTQMLNDYRLAKGEFERVKRLADDGAVAARRVDEARLDYENKASRLRGALGGADFDLDAVLADGDHFHLRAPSSGVISDTHLRFGQHVSTGEHLFNIIDPSRVWLEAQVPVSEAALLDDVSDAYFTVSGSEQTYRVSENGGRLVSASSLLDPLTRRIPVIFELRNENNVFRPGSFAQVFLQTKTTHESPAIPIDAVLDEEGTAVAYVQIGGETFEKRILQTGGNDEGMIAVLSGVREGERVVTRGAYKVRLASLRINPAEAGHAGHNH
ncbi:MAG: efflux RND transporter periplasmic adaptor subunit [bacterium]|nr:efflux RND transporter periplasmic adaptor subunit [bacterium]